MTVIKTKEFILRPYKKGDELSLRENINDKIIARNTQRVPFPYTPKDAKEWISINLKERKKENPTKINFAIDINGEVIGSIGLHDIQGHKAELGYWLAKKHRGKGIITLALKKITEFGFNKLKFRRISANVYPWNKASMRVLEKAGYKFEGVLRKEVKKGNKFLDCHIFAKVK